MSEERILTLHPEGKQGTKISKSKYDAVREAIIAVLETQGPMAWQLLPDAVEARLPDDWSGSTAWYTITVKLDLEARHIVERMPGTSSQEIRLVTH